MLLKSCHILSVGQSHRRPVCTVLLNSNKFLWSIFQNMVVPPHCFCTGSEASLVFHLQTTSKFISEIRVSFPLEFKQFFFFFFLAFCEERGSRFSGMHLKNCWCFNTSLTFKGFNFLYLCFLAASLESEGGAWGLRAAGVSEMMKYLKKKAVFFSSLLMDYWEIFVLMNTRKVISREEEKEGGREEGRKEKGKGGREKERMKGKKIFTCTFSIFSFS